MNDTPPPPEPRPAPPIDMDLRAPSDQLPPPEPAYGIPMVGLGSGGPVVHRPWKLLLLVGLLLLPGVALLGVWFLL